MEKILLFVIGWLPFVKAWGVICDFLFNDGAVPCDFDHWFQRYCVFICFWLPTIIWVVICYRI